MSKDLEDKEIILDSFLKVIDLLELVEEVENDLENDIETNLEPLKTLGDFLIENEDLVAMDIEDLETKPVSKSLITLGNFLEKNSELIDMDLEELDDKEVDARLVALGDKLLQLNEIVEGAEFEGLEDTKKIEDLLHINKFMLDLDEVFQNSIRCFNLMVEMENIQENIDELNSISFDGEVFDCPVHGKIQYLNGKCIVK